MAGELAPQTEAFIQEALAAGRFPSREKLLDAAVAALHNEGHVPMVPEEHMAAVEEGIREANEGKVKEFTEADWDRLRQIVHDAAARQRRA